MRAAIWLCSKNPVTPLINVAVSPRRTLCRTVYVRFCSKARGALAASTFHARPTLVTAGIRRLSLPWQNTSNFIDLEDYVHGW
jgi:hypothetical protein